MIDWPHDRALAGAQAEPGQTEEELHTLGDLAAHVAWFGNQGSDLDRVLDERTAVLGADADAALHLRALWRQLDDEAFRTRFALAQTIPASVEGWQAWAEAAQSQRARTGCTEASRSASRVWAVETYLREQGHQPAA